MEIEVEHPLHGVGVVESWRRGGRIAIVRFARQPLPIEIPSRELGFADGDDAMVVRTRLADRDAGASIARLGDALSGSFARSDAMLTLEAMRLGVVPSAQLEAYTVGRTFEMTLVDGDLDSANERGGAVRAFMGDYGVGKTHLLELILHRALERNFLTARVVLDPEETSPAHPKRVYRAAMRTLRYPDRPFEENAGLELLLEKAAASETARDLLGLGSTVKRTAKAATVKKTIEEGLHLYLSTAVAYMASLDGAASGDKKQQPREIRPEEVEDWVVRARELLTDWIEGHPTVSNQTIDQELNRLPGRHPKVYSLLDYRPWSRIYGYLLSGLSSLARSVGYSGLVVLIDEAEFYGLLSPANREYARDLFRAFSWAAIGGNGQTDESGLPTLPFTQDDLGVGGYGVQRDLPGRYGDHPGLYVVYAMTPHGDGVEALRQAVPASGISQLTALQPVDYVELARRVCDFYASSRPDWTLPEAIVAPLAKVLQGLIQSGYVQNPRHAMKFIIEFLDVVRYEPSQVASVVRNLQSSLVF